MICTTLVPPPPSTPFAAWIRHCVALMGYQSLLKMDNGLSMIRIEIKKNKGGTVDARNNREVLNEL